MGEQDGQTVTETVSEGTVPPVVATTTEAPQVDPTEAKFKEMMAKERATIVEEARRAAQSQADKTSATLRRQLQEERAQRQALEGAFQTLPNQLGDVDPAVRYQVENTGLRSRLSAIQQQDAARQQAERIEEIKRNTLAGVKQEIKDMGLDPDDPRLEYDLDTPDADTFYKKVMRSANKVVQEDVKKSIPDLVKQYLADEKARARKETGVDEHETAGTAGSNSDQDFLAAYASGKVNSKADHKRAKALLDKL